MLTSHSIQDSGIHTMSSRRESAFSDTAIPHPSTTRKINSDCMPFNNRLLHPGRLTQSMEHITKQIADNHITPNYPPSRCYSTNSCNNPETQSIFSNYGSKHDLRTSQCSCHEPPSNVNQCNQNRYPSDPGGKQLLTSSNQVTKKIEKPKSQRLLQLCSQRLLAKTHRTENSILHILEDGEVVVELMRKKGKLKRTVVCEVLRISSDGSKIILYEPNGGKGVVPAETPPPLPQQGGYQVFSIESLPEKHWNKYMHAYQFIALVKEKTPKVTCYSEKTKCVLMENLTDFEVTFYEGGTVTKSSLKGVTFVDSSGNKHNFQNANDCRNLTGTLEFMWSQSQEALKHCLLLEEMLAKVPGPNFPVIIGRRPNSGPSGKENQTHTMMPSFTVSMNSTTAGSSFQSNSTATSKEKRVAVPGIGTAVQLPSGEVRVRYSDGAQLWMDGKHQIRFQSSDGNVVNYTDKDNVPRVVKEKLQHMPKILEHLMPSPVTTHKFRL